MWRCWSYRRTRPHWRSFISLRVTITWSRSISPIIDSPHFHLASLLASSIISGHSSCTITSLFRLRLFSLLFRARAWITLLCLEIPWKRLRPGICSSINYPCLCSWMIRWSGLRKGHESWGIYRLTPKCWLSLSSASWTMPRLSSTWRMSLRN